MIYFSDFSGGGPAPLWTPLDLSDLALWLDPNQQTEADGTEVATFVDRSGNGHDFTESSAGAGPVIRYAYVNGYKALENAAEQMQCANTLLPSSPAAVSAFWAAKGTADPSSSPNDRAPLNGFGTGGVGHYFTDGRWYESFGTNSRRDVNPPTSWAVWHIAGVTSASNDFKMWWNGTAIVTSTSNTVATGTGNRLLFQNYAGHFGDLILTDALPSNNNIKRIVGFLAHKYGTTADLPADHPFKTDAPTVGPSVIYLSQNVSTSAATSISNAGIAEGSPTYAVVAGSLPTGLSLNSSTGEISGTATTPGTYSGIEIEVTEGPYSATSDPFALTVVTGFQHIFFEFVTSNNNFLGGSTVKVLDAGSVDRALASGGASISAVGFTPHGSFPVSNLIDGNDTSFTTSSGANAGVGVGWLLDMGGLHEPDKIGYRTRSDGFGANEGWMTGFVKAKVSLSDPTWTTLVTWNETGWSSNEYREVIV